MFCTPLRRCGVREGAVEGRGRGVLAARDVATGELLLVELVVVGSMARCGDVVAGNKAVWDALHPRDDAWAPCDWEHIAPPRPSWDCTAPPASLQYGIDAATDRKLRCNLYGEGARGVNMLSVTVAAVNHSCTPNARLAGHMLEVRGAPMHAVSITALHDIRAGDEVTVAYAAAAGHEADTWGFECACGTGLEERLAAVDAVRGIPPPDVSVDALPDLDVESAAVQLTHFTHRLLVEDNLLCGCVGVFQPGMRFLRDNPDVHAALGRGRRAAAEFFMAFAAQRWGVLYGEVITPGDLAERMRACGVPELDAGGEDEAAADVGAGPADQEVDVDAFTAAVEVASLD